MTPSHAAAVCYRLTADGPRLLLITTSDGLRWSIPKGYIDPGEPPWRTAARETLEETGWDGAVDRTPLGTFVYRKPFTRGGAQEPAGQRVLVQTFLLQASSRPLAGEQRQQVWLALPDVPRHLRQGREDDPTTVTELLRVIGVALWRIANPG